MLAVAGACFPVTGCNRTIDSFGESSKQATGSSSEVGPSQAKSSGWVTFVPEGGGFSVEFPSQPSYSYQVGPFDAHRFKATGAEKLEYYIGVSNFPLGQIRSSNPGGLLQAAQQQDAYYSNPLETHDITLGDSVGIEEYHGMPQRTNKIIRHYYDNGRVYTVGVSTRSVQDVSVDKPLVAKFFDSFEIRPGLPVKPTGPPQDQQIATWLEALRSGNGLRQSQAALEIAGAEPGDSPNAEINQALVDAYINGKNYVKGDLLKALRTWGIPANAPTLVKALAESEGYQGDLLRVLGRLKNPEVIPEILAFAEQEERGSSVGLVAALSGYGPSIEPRMIKILEANGTSIFMKNIAIDVLERIGTLAAIPVLNNIEENSEDPGIRGAAHLAIMAITQRGQLSSP